MGVDLDRSLAELVLERPSAARVLARLGLDYCCGGRRSLAEGLSRTRPRPGDRRRVPGARG